MRKFLLVTVLYLVSVLIISQGLKFDDIKLLAAGILLAALNSIIVVKS